MCSYKQTETIAIMTTFQYHPDIIARFPSAVGGVILAHGLHNAPSPVELQAVYQAEQQAALQRLGTTPLSQLPSLAAWRSAFRSFGVDPTQYRSAAEALLRRLTKKGNIPSINTLVDIGNLVSIRHALPVAVFDTRALEGAVTVCFADGSERYTTLGQDEVEHPEVGEVIFADATKLVIARRWCWRQSETSAAQLDTTSVIVTVEAHHAGGHNDVAAAVETLLALLHTYADGSFTTGIVDAQQLQITDAIDFQSAR
jgi:DNA/RNA-binding domain of Phe-tRNA-synthetase-like protein